jgi:hypothetical protein
MWRGVSGEGEPVGRSNITAWHASHFEVGSVESLPHGDHCHRRHLVGASIGEYRWGCRGTAIFGSHIGSEQYSALGTWRDSARAVQ